ncbi:hypothetical protein CHT93_10895 [Staphylococcus epidermidis]|nr:hypothetical protein CHT93_10895 [Staphylococcus epidermidis]
MAAERVGAEVGHPGVDGAGHGVGAHPHRSRSPRCGSHAARPGHRQDRQGDHEHQRHGCGPFRNRVKRPECARLGVGACHHLAVLGSLQEWCAAHPDVGAHDGPVGLGPLDLPGPQPEDHGAG